MWLSFSNAFLSIVQPADAGSHLLLVRARREGDIQRIFPTADVHRTPGRDYLFRAYIERGVVGAVIADNIEKISYTNFKDSVSNVPLHNAYSKVWHIMSGLQPLAPYSTVRVSK
mgnify:CR=1 FL=1